MIGLINWAAGGALVDCQGCHGVSLLPNTLKNFLDNAGGLLCLTYPGNSFESP